jgi:hypothetical protein
VRWRKKFECFKSFVTSNIEVHSLYLSSLHFALAKGCLLSVVPTDRILENVVCSTPIPAFSNLYYMLRLPSNAHLLCMSITLG